MEDLQKIPEVYPGSEITKYGEHIELRLRVGSEKGHCKISGTVDQVKRSTEIILQKLHNQKAPWSN